MPEVAQVALRGRHWLRAVVWVSEWTTALFSLGSNCPRVWSVLWMRRAEQSGMVTVRCRGGLPPAACRGLKRIAPCGLVVVQWCALQARNASSLE